MKPACALLATLMFLLPACGKSHTSDGGIPDARTLDGPGPDSPGRRDGGVDGCMPTTETCNGLDDDCDGVIDDGPPVGLGCMATEVCGFGGTCCDPAAARLDMLLMIDNSNSMTEEQISFSEQFPRIIQTLATGDVGLDGTMDFQPIDDLHVGVVTTDMGVGGYRVPTCTDEPNFGDDGILRTTGNVSIPGCMATYSPVLQFMPGRDDPATFANDVNCVARVGTGGCGFEQPLESVLKALTPSTSSITFSMGTVGHGDGANAGFLRRDSVLAVILLTDEEDCSASDTDIFNPSSSRYSGDLNLRCFQFPDAVYPIDRYVDGLLALRPRSPSQLVFAVIAGVPEDLVRDPSSTDYFAILDDPRMEERIDPANPTRLVPSCNVPGRGLAFPPRRLVSVARSIEARGGLATVQSICQPDFSPALSAIIERMRGPLTRACE